MFIVKFASSAIIGLMAFTTSACTADATPIVYNGSVNPNEPCSTAREIASSVTLRTVDPTQAALMSSSFTWRSAKNEELNIENVRHISGSCAPLLSGFLATNLYFGKATTLSGFVGHPEVVQRASGPTTDNLDAINNPGILTQWKKGQFVTASLIRNERKDGKLSTVYVGLWRTKAHSHLGVFRKNSTGIFDEPSWLGSSNLPIRSISFFPAYDIKAGKLGILQEGPEGLRLVNVNWMHPDL